METLWRLHKCFFPCAPALAHTRGNFTRVNKPLLLLLTIFHVSAWTIAAAIHNSSREIRSSEITPLMVNHTNDRLSKLAEQEACTVQIECVTGSKSTAKDRAYSCSSPRNLSLWNWTPPQPHKASRGSFPFPFHANSQRAKQSLSWLFEAQWFEPYGFFCSQQNITGQWSQTLYFSIFPLEAPS